MPEPETTETVCPTPENHSENGGPFRYCSCGWMEAVVIPIPDVDGIEARVARIESMVADMHGVVMKIGPIVSAVSQEMAEKGPIGMMGYLMAAIKQG